MWLMWQDMMLGLRLALFGNCWPAAVTHLKICLWRLVSWHGLSLSDLRLAVSRVNIVWFCRTFNDDVFYVRCQRFKNNFWLWLLKKSILIEGALWDTKYALKEGNTGKTPREPWLDLRRLEWDLPQKNLKTYLSNKTKNTFPVDVFYDYWKMPDIRSH